MNLSVVIPNYNGENLLKKNLQKVIDAISLYRLGKVEVIIADDFSTDNSREVINRYTEKYNRENLIVKAIYNNEKKERGFAKNVNRGVKVAKGEILILLNTDAVPKHNFLEPLLTHFNERDVFAVGCMDESREREGTVLRGRGIGKFRRGFLVHERGEVDKQNTLWVSCGSGAFRKAIWEKLGGLDELYSPFYWEDIDISYVAQKSGYRAVFEPKSQVIHLHEEGVIKRTFKDSYVRSISYRNQIIFIWKNVTDKYLLLKHILWMPFHIANSVRTGDWQFCVGFLLALLKFDQILKSRKRTAKMFIKSDREIIKQY